MYPFLYYVDCEGSLWVPCSCRCGSGVADLAAANGRVAERRNDYPAGDSFERRGIECIRPASESEKTMLHRGQDFEKLLSEALEAIKRLEKLHEGDL